MVYLVLKYAIFVVMPFLIGFAIAALLNPAVRFLSRRFGMKPKPCAVMILSIFLATIGMLVTVAAVRLTVWAGEVSGSLPALYADTIEPALTEAFAWAGGILTRFERYLGDDFADHAAALFASARTSLGTAVSDISVKALGRLSAFAAAIPGFVVQLVFAVISAFFFLADFEELLSFLKRHLPQKAVSVLGRLRGQLGRIAGRYLRSYALIMLITFAELSLGLLLLRVERAFLRAAVIALFDVLPLLGCGGILLPWALFALLRGERGLALGLVILWAVITLVRNVIEPRIVGRQVGLHPLMTLAAMFVGTKLFGIVGLFLLPAAASVAVSLWRGQEDG